MREQDADVIVVGCGPIGSYAAWQFACRGLRVLALEQSRAEEPASRIGAFHFERHAFDRAGIPLPSEENVICKYPGLTVHSPDGKHSLQVPGVETWAMDLDFFIRDLRKRAQRAGVRFLFGRRVTDVITDSGRLSGVRIREQGRLPVPRIREQGKVAGLRIRGQDRMAGARLHEQGRTADASSRRPGKVADVKNQACRDCGSEEYFAPVIVDSTGLARAIRRQVPAFRHAGEGLGFSVYMEYWRHAETSPGQGIHSYMGGNAWTARYPDYWIVGMGGPQSPEETVAAFRIWVKERFPGEREVLHTVSGAIPYTFPPSTFVDDGVLILGDAAATNKPYNGEGISSGMTLARIAADVLPGAVEAGATRRSLWEINRRYFTGEGSRFAFLRAMGFALLDQPEQELNAAFRIGLVNSEDLAQVFVEHAVKRSMSRWVGPLARLSFRGRMAARYVKAVFRASRIARLCERYPPEEAFGIWQKEYERQLAAFRRMGQRSWFLGCASATRSTRKFAADQ